MRKSRYIQFVATAALSALFLISGSSLANAQQREHYSIREGARDRNKPAKERIVKHKKRYHHDRVERSRSHQDNHKYHGSYHKGRKGKHPHHVHKSYHKPYHHKHYNGHHNNYNRHEKVHHGYYYTHGDHYRRAAHRYYNHPRYGRVVARFGYKPVVIRHRHGNYYYADGCYYRYHGNVGYVVVEAPRKVYFEELPHGCEHVCHSGGDYYMYGDLCFEKHRTGFRLVARPSGLNVSVRF